MILTLQTAHRILSSGLYYVGWSRWITALAVERDVLNGVPTDAQEGSFLARHKNLKKILDFIPSFSFFSGLKLVADIIATSITLSSNEPEQQKQQGWAVLLFALNLAELSYKMYQRVNNQNKNNLEIELNLLRELGGLRMQNQDLSPALKALNPHKKETSKQDESKEVSKKTSTLAAKTEREALMQASRMYLPGLALAAVIGFTRSWYEGVVGTLNTAIMLPYFAIKEYQAYNGLTKGINALRTELGVNLSGQTLQDYVLAEKLHYEAAKKVAPGQEEAYEAAKNDAIADYQNQYRNQSCTKTVTDIAKKYGKDVENGAVSFRKHTSSLDWVEYITLHSKPAHAKSL